MAETTKLAAHTFEPWATRDGQQVLASDAVWREPLEWNRKAVDCGHTCRAGTGDGIACPHDSCDIDDGIRTAYRPRVVVDCDVFEDWQGLVHESSGEIARHLSPDMNNRPLKMRYVRRRLFGLIDQTPNLDWLLLTKRPENIRRMWAESLTGKYVAPFPGALGARRVPEQRKLRRDNVWLGTSVSDQTTANDAVDKLVECRDLSPVLFLSVEPLLGPVDLSGYLGNLLPSEHGKHNWPERGIDWVIVGGESGPNARPCDSQWIETIVAHCASASVPCFVKQLGSNPFQHFAGQQLRPLLTDPKGSDPAEWPEKLCVQQLPEVTR